MKKILCILFGFVITIIASACTAEQTQTEKRTNDRSSVAAVIEQQVLQLTPTSVPVIAESQPTMDIFSLIPQNAPTPVVMDMEALMAMSTDVDIDLTKLSSTMVYSQVYSMMDQPDQYVGKTVRMTGQFSVFEPTDQNGQPIPDLIYLSCVVLDATACCQQGIEFTLAGNAVYPNDYPEPDSMITVVGELEVYEEGPFRFLRLKDAVMEA